MSHQSSPFASEGEWLKCALHTHSSVSDGTLPPNLLARAYEEAGFDVLSMGMSGDFEIAVEEGSTLVRIGTGLFRAAP